MSETEFQRLSEKINEVHSMVAVVMDNTKDYQATRDMVQRHEYQLEQQLRQCAEIQAARKDKVAPWITIRNTVIAGSIMLIIGTLFGFFLTLLAK